MKRLSIFLITAALIAGMVSCIPGRTVQYSLRISSTAGGTVTTPGDGIFTYDKGTVVNLVAKPDAGYRFVSWFGNVDTIANVGAAETTIIMNNHYYIIAEFDR